METELLEVMGFGWSDQKTGSFPDREAATRIAGRPLMLLHAEGDEKIPVDFSAEIYARAGEPRKLITPPGGHHRSIQHDEELQAEALRWLNRELA